MKTTRFFLLAIFLLAASVTVIYSCKKDKDNTPTVPVYTNGQGEVGSAGGTVMIDDANSPINGASIEIPEGALNSTVDIKIVTAPSNIYVSGDEQVVLVGFEPNGLTFEKPVEIKLPYDSGNANNQRAFFYNPETFEISQIPVTSATNGVVIATTNHFSYYFATNENFGLGIEMLNIGGKIGARVNYMSFNSNDGIYNIPAVSYDNAHNAIISSTDAVYSFFKVNLFEKNDFWFDSDKGIKNIQVKKYRLNSIIKADILLGGSTVYLTDNLTLEEGGTCDLWFEGKPLIFYFENFTPSSSDSYYVRVKWRLTRHATNIDNVDVRYTDLYEVNNEDADKKLSEMGSFASGDLFEECIDEQYINGSGLKPGVITNEASLITCSSARLNGTLDNLGSGQITRHGFCLSETPSPTVNDEHVINLGAIDEQGSFNYDYSFTPPHLLPNTQYYYRAYAENSAGVAYGEDITFWTSDDSEAPTFIGHEPGVGETVSGNVNIIISILEGCGIDKAEFYVKPNGGNYTLIGEDPEPSYISNDVYHATIAWNTNEFTNGSYTIKVLANDMAGLLNNKTWDVIVNNSGSNTPPTALFTVSPTSGTTSTNFAFDASGCTDNETPTNQLQVRWDFDGNGSWDTNWDTDKTQYHQYSSEATYNAKLEVKDTEGLTDQYTKSITVSNSPVNLSQNLLHYYPLNGDLLDVVGNNHFTNNGSVDDVGKIENGRKFNENTTGQFAQAASISLTSAASMSFWVYSFQDHPAATGVLFKAYGSPHGDQSIFGCQAAGNTLYLSAQGTSTGVGVSLEITHNVWHHVVLVFDGQNQIMKAFLDGIKTEIPTGFATLYNPTTKIKMGMQKYTSRSFKGKLDEIGYWNRVLSDLEVSILYNGGNGLAYPF